MATIAGKHAIDELETALRASFDRDTIAVYGDQLQASGEPRGELIAIDLRIDDTGAELELARRRAELIRTWLGTSLPHGTLRYGFVELDATSADPIAQVRVAFEGPAAPYVRSVAIVGPPKQIAGALAIITKEPRPALVRLTIRQWSEHKASTLDEGAMLAFERALPNLDTLELDGRRVFATLSHTRIRRLRLSGFDAIESAPVVGIRLPALSELDLAFHCHLAARHDAPPIDLAATLLRPDVLTRLVQLELSRNEPGYLDPNSLGGMTSAFEFLRELPIRAQLQTVRLPQLTADDLPLVRTLLAQMPALRELAIATTSTRPLGGDLTHPTAQVRFFAR